MYTIYTVYYIYTCMYAYILICIYILIHIRTYIGTPAVKTVALTEILKILKILHMTYTHIYRNACRQNRCSDRNSENSENSAYDICTHI